MTTRADLLRLADRVEREEPSDELNWCIQESVHPTWRRTTAEPYATSLDAAASLVPDGWRVWTMDEHIDGGFWIILAKDQKMVRGAAPTEPRTRTAAALRARAQEIADDR